VRYAVRRSSLVWYSPVTYDATSWESVYILISSTSISSASLSPAKKASYSA
ncbi:hypothetical protein A2U01_0093354, partial [Trifolium medium]|nr:hypothetical protein [Trifolium medium]